MQVSCLPCSPRVSAGGARGTAPQKGFKKRASIPAGIMLRASKDLGFAAQIHVKGWLGKSSSEVFCQSLAICEKTSLWREEANNMHFGEVLLEHEQDIAHFLKS